MAGPKRFEDLQAWQKARGLVNRTYDMTQQGPLARDFGLRDQIQRASFPIMRNIAEGSDRTHKAEKLQFYRVARASADELGKIIQGLVRSFQETGS